MHQLPFHLRTNKSESKADCQKRLKKFLECCSILYYGKIQQFKQFYLGISILPQRNNTLSHWYILYLFLMCELVPRGKRIWRKFLILANNYNIQIVLTLLKKLLNYFIKFKIRCELKSLHDDWWHGVAHFRLKTADCLTTEQETAGQHLPLDEQQRRMIKRFPDSHDF